VFCSCNRSVEVSFYPSSFRSTCKRTLRLTITSFRAEELTAAGRSSSEPEHAVSSKTRQGLGRQCVRGSTTAPGSSNQHPRCRCSPTVLVRTAGAFSVRQVRAVIERELRRASEPKLRTDESVRRSGSRTDAAHGHRRHSGRARLPPVDAQLTCAPPTAPHGFAC